MISAWAFARPYRPVEPLPAAIVDMHCHIAGIGAGGSGCFVSPQLRNNWRFKAYLRSFGTSEHELLQKGDLIVGDRLAGLLSESQHVSHAVVLALDGCVGRDGVLDAGRTEVYVPNTFVLEVVKRHTNLLFGASIHPYRTNALEELAWAKSQGAVLVKWLPSIMNFDPADPALIPFYQKLVELELPLLTHTGNERSFSTAQEEFGDPARLELPLQLGVTVIAAHIGSTGYFQKQRSTDRLAALMLRHTNLLSDISSLTQINKRPCMKEALLRNDFEGRLLYGSDFPLINPPLVSEWIYLFRLSPTALWRISRIDNPWDADVELKRQLGTPGAIFARPRQKLVVNH